MVIERINNWFNLSKQYFFTFSNGFFNLSYLSNSPEVMVKSFSKMPFMKKDDEKQMLYADTPFVKGEFQYVELEDGLWIMSSAMFYKNNVSYKPVYDKFLPADYYFITINRIENKINSGSYRFDDFMVQNNSISFSKPGTDFLNCHFKGSEEIMYILYFSKDWAAKNIINSSTAPRAVKDLLISPDKDFLNYTYDYRIFGNIIEQFSVLFHSSSIPNVFELKKLAYNYLTQFFVSLEKKEYFDSSELSHKDRLKIQKIEHYLRNNLYTKFPGIEMLSKKYHISPTSLKKNFKVMYGSTMLQYFQQKKMELARVYLESTDLKIKDISFKLSYDNVSKFSKTFKKYHGKLPSDIKK